MPISIKNPETEELARKLAQLTGESLTDAIRGALAEKCQRLSRKRPGCSLAAQLNSIALRSARRPQISHLTPDEILGYDDLGAPTR
jgi:antitoxin VapB